MAFRPPSRFMCAPRGPVLRRGLLASLLLVLAWPVAGQELRFNIYKGDARVGQIQAHRSTQAGRTSYSIVSQAEISVLWKQIVRTRMQVEYQGLQLLNCHSSLNLNGSLRDSSHLSLHGGERWAYVHPRPPFRLHSANAWTTARMYYEEPVGRSSILVESVLQDCPIRRTGPGSYEEVLPNNDRNRYRYVNGELMEVQVDRLLVNLVFRRA